jgi:hypothetical protein
MRRGSFLEYQGSADRVVPRHPVIGEPELAVIQNSRARIQLHDAEDCGTNLKL